MKLEPTPTSAEFDVLANEYQAGLEKCEASGYEEYGPDFQRRQQMIIAALRAASSLRASVAGMREPDAWQCRACIGGQWGGWLIIDQPIERFVERNKFNLDNGTYEMRPLYAAPSPSSSEPSDAKMPSWDSYSSAQSGRTTTT